MNQSSFLPAVLAELTRAARDRGWTDSAWARAASLPKETLSRTRSRATCDLATLDRLARAVGRAVDVRPTPSPDGLWPASVDRALEQALVDLAATHSTRFDDWRNHGPPFFLAGLAVTLASVTGFERADYLALAETLHPGAAEPRVYERWLAETPLSPDRYVRNVRAAADAGA